MKKANNYFNKVIGMIFIICILLSGMTMFNEVVLDELENLLYNDEYGRFDLGDLTLGITCMLSLIYSGIRIIEGIFRKEDKEKS